MECVQLYGGGHHLPPVAAATRTDVFATCGSPEVHTGCTQPVRYVNWGGVHMTEAMHMYKVVAGMFFQDTDGKYFRPAFGSLLARKGHSN